MMDIAQIAIVLLGGAAIYFLASPDALVRRWGYLSGLLSEPFWIYAAITDKQWGVLMMALWWGGFYFVGLINNWSVQ